MTQFKISTTGINLAKPAKFFLCDKQVNIHIPLPKQTCSNWSDECNQYDNIGVLYREKQVTLRQLNYIVKCFENKPDYMIHSSFKTEQLTFDGHVITAKDINDIKHIIEAVQRKQPVSNYGDARSFPRDCQIVL